MEPNNIKCPKCSSTQLYFDKKGFSGKKAVVGAVLTGGVGLLAGTLGSNKVVANCLACGNKFSPVQINPSAPIRKNETKIAKVLSILIFSFCIFILLILSLVYFNMDKSAAKSSAGMGIIVITLLACFFGFLVKSFKKPASIT